MIPPPSNDQPSPGHLPQRGPAPNPGNGALKPTEIFVPTPRGRQMLSGQKVNMNASAFKNALRRRWLLVLLVGPIVAGLAAVGAYFGYALLDTRTHTAYVMMPIKTAQEVDNVRQTNPDHSGSYQRAQRQLASSRLVLNHALKNPKVAGLAVVKEERDPVQWLEKRIQVDYAGGQEFLRISMSGSDPKELQVFVAAVQDSYWSEVVLKEHAKRMLKVERLREIAQKYEGKLKNRLSVFKDLAEAADGHDKKDLETKKMHALQQLHALQADLIQLRRGAREYQVDLAAQMARLQSMSDPKMAAELARNDPLIEELMNRDTAVSRLKADEEAILKKIADVKKVAPPASVAQLVYPHEKQLESVRAELNRKREELRPILVRQLRERSQAELQLSVHLLRAKIERTEQLEKSLNDEIKSCERNSKSLTGKAVEMAPLKAEIENIEAIWKKASLEAELLEAERNTPPRIEKQQDDPYVIESEHSKRRLMASGGAALAALALFLAAVTWLEVRARRIATVDEVVHGLGMTVLGALPAWRSPAGRRLIGYNSYRDIHWQSLFTESVDATRTVLLHAARQEDLRVILVTSAVSGEGKTSLSTHLATSLARAGRRTLLVDCDLRNPAAHRLFDLPLSPGFSEVLRADAELSTAIQETSVPALWMITAGQCDERSLQGLTQDDARVLFARLKEQFEFVVVDSAPVLPVADSLLLAQHVDAVLFSILRDVSRIPMVYTAYQRLEQLGARMLGAVVSGAREESQGYSYGYYGYGYGYGSPRASGGAPSESSETPA